ncbi:MAG TPA: restriction endonuclease subunit S [Lysinibacillus sp.]|jgi:type I restriction enzyme S subunit|uniref:Type I restriction endonuclease subunit S n=1 Tax=Lactococcus lactis TaxID=1358 RepID=A0AAX0PYH6_9LACT|nr:restriction endonuclease subunit S [Lactococcus lactis]HBT71991.1 restriction endonuclease subunit S [Lysinibacillus sp.]MCO0831091.1 restriction endonuclease subunit S [Lactococcus lactis]PAK88010.1 type I restriction endonuclease subunit S [Lactococcus lactis]PAL02390.1 type I restriction endonuclease subunit S [Lactococcus lactis]RQE33882.1 restriction endonuclease subunit S [Lactococcus lactis]
MMSKKSPQLRFEGFTDDWEERKLSSISERVTRKNKNNESTLPLTISAQDGLIDQNDFFNKQVASRDVTGYFLVKNGEFAYNKSYSNGYPWGAIKRLDKYDMGVLSTLYIVFRPTEINSQFLVSYYDTTRWYREVSKNAAEGARNHGLLNIAPTDFFNTLLVVPKIVDEQEKIGSFFKQMDNTIALHQRKLDLLKEQKKGYLQKMFPKNGEKVPELRFAGFADDWEERKLGDEVNINGRIGFRGYTQADIVTKETGVLAYSPTNIVNNRLYRKRSDTYITKQKYRESPEIMVKNSDILFVKTGSTLGKSALVQSINYHATVNPQIVIIRSNELDEYFLSVILTSYNILKRINTIKIGGAIPTMTETELKKFPIQVPKSTEQKKIGSFFKQLDNTIALHQRKLDLLKEQKKGFLQKMFV